MRIPAPVLLASLALVGIAADRGRAGDGADSSAAALARELEAELAEITRPPATDLFEDGRKPELVVLSSQSVWGETVPCG
jgi:hypothetical protein